MPEANFNKIRTNFFFGLLLILGVVLLLVFKPFFYPIFWAAILAITFYPVYRWFHHYLRSAILSDFITLIIIVAIIIIPLYIIFTLLFNQSFEIYQNVAQTNILGQVKNVAHWLENTPVAPFLQEIRNYWNEHAQNIVRTVSLFFLDNVTSFTQNSLLFLAQFFLMLYTLFFFLKDGEKLLKKLMYLSPLGDDHEKLLYQKFISTARATLKGTILVGLVQGFLGGILFWAVGIQGPVIWGLIMTVASVIPPFGTGIIWLPMGIIMLALGNTWQGIMILLFGVLVVGTIDNLLRPIWVGKDSQLHPLIILFSSLGGIAMFGVSGLVIGPVLAALFLAILSIYEHHYRKDLDKN